MTHSAHILGLDTVRAWHSGPRLIVEVDIVLDEKMVLRETHDIAEALQTKLESLPNVERCCEYSSLSTIFDDCASWLTCSRCSLRFRGLAQAGAFHEEAAI